MPNLSGRKSTCATPAKYFDRTNVIDLTLDDTPILDKGHPIIEDAQLIVPRDVIDLTMDVDEPFIESPPKTVFSVKCVDVHFYLVSAFVQIHSISANADGSQVDKDYPIKVTLKASPSGHLYLLNHRELLSELGVDINFDLILWRLLSDPDSPFGHRWTRHYVWVHFHVGYMQDDEFITLKEDGAVTHHDALAETPFLFNH